MQSGPFHAYTDRRGGLSIVVVVGELDLATRNEFFDVIADAEAGGSELVLDLRELSFIDASGLRVVAHAAERAAARGGRLQVVRPTSHIGRVFEIAQLAAAVDWLDAVPL